MGITGLLPFLKNASRPVHVREFKGMTCAIDVYCWLHKGAFGCAEQLVQGKPTDLYIKYVMKYIDMLLYHDIKPILVFDGRNLPSKAETEKKRRENRRANKDKAVQLLSEGKAKEARDYFQRCVDITPQMARDVIAASRERNIDCIVAPYEADAQLAYLNIAGLADFIITEDSDLTLFGCDRIVFKLSPNGDGTLYEKSRLNEVFGSMAAQFDFEKFRKMCIISGCDYMASLPGIGLGKAKQFWSKISNPNLYSVLPKIPHYMKMPALTVTQSYMDGFVQADNTFLYQVVFDPITRRERPLTDYKADINPEQLSYCGHFSDKDTALQLALGNMDLHTLKQVNHFNPDRLSLGKTAKYGTVAKHQSIWTKGYSAAKSHRVNNSIMSMSMSTTSSKSKQITVTTSFPTMEPNKKTHRMLPKQYYHYPVKIIPDSDPLKGSVTCVSGYSGKERNFISTVIALLGGNPQDMFAKKDNKDKGVVASTHLVCNAPEGPKYKAALNWGIPVIHKDWMRACLKEWKWISEQPFLIGDSKAFSKDKPLPSVQLDDEVKQGDDTTAGETTLVDNQEDGELEEKENTVLQDMDQNRSTRSALSRRSSKSNIVDKANISTSKSRRDSNAADTDKPETADVKTPVQSSSAAKRLSVHQDDNNPKTPALTPGMERLRAPLVDMYSPLPSQPWPDSQQDCATPINHRQSRTSMAAAGSGMKRKRGPDDDGLADMPTPKTPYGEHLGADPSPDTRKFFKRRRDETLKFAEVFSMDEAEMAKQKRRQAEWLKKTSAKPNQEKDESLTEETNTNKLESKESLDAKMRENYKKKGQNWDDIGADFTRKQSEPSDDEGKCLTGCVIMIAKKISQMNKELESIVEELGGEISHHLDEATTHYVFQGKQREATKEFKQAKEMGKIIVAPEWIYMCRSEERKVGEAAFPCTYNPSKLVNQSTMHKTALNDAGSAASNKTKSRLTKAKLPQPDFQENEETKLDDEEMDNDHENNETLAADTTVPMDSNNQSTIPGSATKVTESGYKKSFKELQSLAESLKNSPALSIVSSVKKQKQNNKADTSLTDTTPLTTPQKPIVADEKEKESQVIWLDPEEQKNKEAMALKLSMETPDLGSINFSENMTAAFDTSMDNNSAANKIFTITSGIDESKAREIVESLGSVLDIEIGPDNLPTHVIVGKVSRSEKMLLCIASGRWILHASYLEESKKAGRWLQEENYELGNPDNTFLDLTENTTECKMSIAARKRRLEASRPGARPVFADLITYLALPSHKQGPFLRLIKAGGGTVVDELTSENMRTLTHVITENKYYSLIEGKSSQLCELSIPIIAPIYLNDYLINEALPLVENYLAENYKPKWEESKRTRGRNSSLSSDTTTSGRRKRRTNS